MRKSVALTPQDNDAVVALRLDVSWQNAVLEIAGVKLSDTPSEAEALHALVEVGRLAVAQRVSENAMESGYSALAEAQTGEDLAIARATGKRTARLAD